MPADKDQPKPIESDHIFTFYQGEKGKEGVQAFSFRIATADYKFGDTTVTVPKKLGDGNFGMVFEAPSTNRAFGTFALKILYQHRAPSPSGRKEDTSRGERQLLEELHIGVKLPELLKPIAEHKSIDQYDPTFPKDGKGQSEWLVLPVAYLEDFDDFFGRADLEKYDVKFSSYAYIMDKFDYSLKDLMEEPIAGAIGGYGRLKRATLRQRECSAIPLLDQMSRGLQILHAAGLRHQDIKPGNIYLRKSGDNLVLRLGDLGFLRPHNPTLGGTAAASTDTVGIGTKHYRSIEQIDFSDAAECDVDLSDEPGVATLTSRDPKFTDTIMRPGDLAYFSKSSSHRLMRIETLDKKPDEGLVTVRVSHKVPPAKDENSEGEEANPLVADKKTQVAFFKNPSAKTDLFGLGSILYDMLTVGDSPERFYELLRRYDRENVDIKARILDRYPTYIAGTLEDPDLSAIFSRVNSRSDRGQTVHAEVLSLLLRCMMSDAGGSFYQELGFTAAEGVGEDNVDIEGRLSAVGAWAKVIKDIKKVGQTISAEAYVQHTFNVLTKSATADDTAPDKESTGPPTDTQENWRIGLTRVLEAYLHGVAPADYNADDAPAFPEKGEAVRTARAYRWVMGALLVFRINEWIDRYLREHRGSLRSLSQEHVSVGTHGIVAWREVVTDAENMMVRCLRTRDPLLTRIRPFASRFEPVWWRYGTRRIRLKELKQASASSGEDTNADTDRAGQPGLYSVEYDFFDFAFAANSVEKDDFILAADSANSSVFRVEAVESESRLLVRLCQDEEATQAEDREQRNRNVGSLEDAYLVKTPNAVDYYAGMLSVYLYHFLISYGAGQMERIGDFPASVYAGIRDFPVRFATAPSEVQNAVVDRTPWQSLKIHTLRLVVWLSLGGFSFDAKGERLKEEWQRWGRTNGEINKWFAALKTFAVKRGDEVNNWNMLTTKTDDGTFGENVVGQFDEIKAVEWRKICEAYVGTAGSGSDDDPEDARGVGLMSWFRGK